MRYHPARYTMQQIQMREDAAALREWRDNNECLACGRLLHPQKLRLACCARCWNAMLRAQRARRRDP